MKLLFFNILHTLVIGIFFIVIGIMKEKTPSYLYYILSILLILIPFAMSFHRPFTLDYWTFIKLFHYLIIIPGILYINYLIHINKKLSKNTYDLILFLGIFIVLYHSFKIYQRRNQLNFI